MKVLDYDGTEHLINKLIDTINSGGSADYIVEEGRSGIWTYRKWASGIAECWFTRPSTGPVALTTAWVSPVYYSGSAYSRYAYPVGLFIDVPTVHATLDSNPSSVWLMTRGTSGTQGTKDSTPAYQFARAGSIESVDISLMITARGFWKEFTPSVSRMNPKKGTFTCVIPRLANQNVTFNYTQVAENILVATAEITANTSSDSGRLYLYFEGSPSGLPFTPLEGFGGCECGDVCYSMASSSNKNLWIGGLTGAMASGKYMTMRFILIG